jgi:hypothetical protein
LWPFAAAAGFHLEEAAIADIQRAILAKELTATELVGIFVFGDRRRFRRRRIVEAELRQ